MTENGIVFSRRPLPVVLALYMKQTPKPQTHALWHRTHGIVVILERRLTRRSRAVPQGGSFGRAAAIRLIVSSSDGTDSQFRRQDSPQNRRNIDLGAIEISRICSIFIGSLPPWPGRGLLDGRMNTNYMNRTLIENWLFPPWSGWTSRFILLLQSETGS